MAIGIQTQKGAHRGQAIDGRFRVTQVLFDENEHWKLASIHLSAIADGA